MKTYCRLIVMVVSLIALQSAATIIHRSFRTREAGFGFGAGRAGAAYPVDARIDKALDEARQKEAEKVKVIIGRCTKVSDGDTIHVVTDGNVKFKVRLDRIDAPESDQPYGKESTAYLTKLIKGRTVRVEWQKKDQYGRVLGIVYATVPPSYTVPPALSPAGAGKRAGSSAPAAESVSTCEATAKRRLRWCGGTVLVGSGGTVKPIDINLHLVATGNAHHYSHFDKTPAYIAAEAAAKEKKLGLWASDNPINPYEWRKAKRRM